MLYYMLHVRSYVIYYMLHVIQYVTCYMLHVKSYMLYSMLSVIFYMLHVTCYIIFAPPVSHRARKKQSFVKDKKVHTNSHCKWQNFSVHVLNYFINTNFVESSEERKRCITTFFALFDMLWSVQILLSFPLFFILFLPLGTCFPRELTIDWFQDILLIKSVGDAQPSTPPPFLLKKLNGQKAKDVSY
jgi:hypothetical protein